MDRRAFLKSTGAVAMGAHMLPFLKTIPAAAGTVDTVVVVFGQTINSLDIHRKGTNRPSYQVAVNCYDRLVSFGTKTLADGSLSYDYSVIQPEIAESWEIADDGMSVIFKLKDNGVFWDGSPITAEDVKWSFDRAITLGGFPAVQMKAGSLESVDQFEVVGEKLFKINFVRKSKLTIPDLAVPVAVVINSKVAKANATTDDPWAAEYLHRNPAGSGAYKVARWEPGQQLVYERNDAWTGGQLPAAKRIILREVPSAATRRALVERGDVDLSFDLPPKDAKELAEMKKLVVTSTPIENSIYVVGVNFQFEPFKDKLVRQALAHAIPYEEIFQTAAYGRGVPMWGGKSKTPEDITWPQPFPYSTDYDKAKELLAQSSFKDGFEVPFFIDLSQSDWMEPAALLVQEGLAKIGIKAPIEKIPGANWRTASLVEKRLPLHLETFGGWLNYPCYYFFWSYLKGHLFNSSNYENPEIETLVGETLHIEVDNPDYAPKIKRMIEIAWDDLPRIALWQPALNSVMSAEVKGYEYWFHRQLDIRKLGKA